MWIAWLICSLTLAQVSESPPEAKPPDVKTIDRPALEALVLQLWTAARDQQKLLDEEKKRANQLKQRLAQLDGQLKQLDRLAKKPQAAPAARPATPGVARGDEPPAKDDKKFASGRDVIKAIPKEMLRQSFDLPIDETRFREYCQKELVGRPFESEVIVNQVSFGEQQNDGSRRVYMYSPQEEAQDSDTNRTFRWHVSLNGVAPNDKSPFMQIRVNDRINVKGRIRYVQPSYQSRDNKLYVYITVDIQTPQ